MTMCVFVGWASARLVRDLDIKRYDITVCYG